MAKAAWDFWIDRGGTFTDIVARAPRRHAARAQAAVGKSRGLCRRRRAGHPRSARAEGRRADPGRQGRRREDGHHRRHQCAAGAQGRPHAAPHHQGFPRRAARSATRRGRRSSPSRSSSPTCSTSASSRSTSACAPTARSSARSTSTRCAATSKRRRPTASTPSPSCSCTPIAIPSTRSRWRRSRARWASRQVSVSHEVSPLIKLVGRGDTTVVDAYLSPILRRYVAQVAR